jgi:hypothetical protein
MAPSLKPDPVTARQVEAMAGYGIAVSEIATVLTLDPETLRQLYRAELDGGHIKANSKVAENLYRKATGEGREAVVAAIFWLKTRAGWKETSVHEVGGVLGNPLSVEVTVNAREILAQRLAQIADRTSASKIRPSGA